MKKIFVLVILNGLSSILIAQSFRINITDNNGLIYGQTSYTITQDSLIIKAKSDYGRTNVDYLSRVLTAEEKISLNKFVKSFPADSLVETYFNEYNNFSYIDAEHAPRVLEISFTKNNKPIHSKATNAYVNFYARLFNKINKILPPEVKIKYDKLQFNAFY